MTTTCTRAIIVKVSLTKVSLKNDIDSNAPSTVFAKEAVDPETGTKDKKLLLKTIALVH